MIELRSGAVGAVCVIICLRLRKEFVLEFEDE